MEEKIETLACLIIDDPLLKPHYGCLDYETLLQEMKTYNFFTEIAFIPWNYKRSHSRITRLFAEHPNYFSMCVHGCNHTSCEYGSKDQESLKALTSTALFRMEEHKKRTGLPYDPVMVFPQGHFSTIAMKVLKEEGFHAAFNSTLQAVDIEDNLPLAEHRRPFTTVYHDFPLFLRRYPDDRSGILQDISSGRPIILVEHHHIFKNGFKKLGDSIKWINSLGNIKWKSLSYITEHHYGKIIPHKKMSIMMNKPKLNPRVNAKIAFRRIASEIRDNYIETSDVLTKGYRLLRG